MRLSTRGKYALEALVYLGYANKSEGPVSVSNVSEVTGISDGYLEQLFRSLKKDRIVESRKGKYGGYLLKKSADEITVGDVLLSVEGPMSLVRCADSEKCTRHSWCLTHKLWESSYSAISDFIHSVYLSELIDDYEKNLNEKEGAV